MSIEVKKLWDNLIPVLKEYKNIWSMETIYEYPNHLQYIPEKLFNEIISLNNEEIFFTLRQDNQSQHSPNISILVRLLKEITTLESIQGNSYSLNILESRYMTPKKKHEIEKVIDVLLKEHNFLNINKVVDCCGGAGYLANSMSKIFKAKVISVDNDNKIQQNGLKRFLKHGNCNVCYLTNDLNTDRAEIINQVKGSDLLIGVHTCSHLSDLQLQLAVETNTRLIFNIGCCYYKTKGYKYGISNISKQTNIALTGPSLLLAARGIETDLNSFIFSINVKKYRYLLHIYLKEILGLEFKSVGGLKPREYERSFDDYAVSRINTLGINGEAHRKDLINFHKNNSRQNTVREMITVNAIRSIFSRAVELYIALDRALYLLESGYNAKVFECFDPKISPRNISVMGVKD